MNNISTVTRDEVVLLDADLREIYKDYGTSKLILLKHNEEKSVVDEVYEQYTNQAVYDPYPVLGMVLMDKSYDETGTELGQLREPNLYKIKVLHSSVTEQWLRDITLRDKLKYGDTELNILSVKPQPIIGDYCVQYSIIASGEMLDWEVQPHGK